MGQAFYNENDPRAAAWLRELIKAGLIAPGVVDERSILDIRPHELTGFMQQHFFAGIGGWSLALRIAGWPDTRPVRTGSCPCQPFSAAGKMRGEADERHLWPSFRDLIAFGGDTVTFGEQVASALGREWLSGVRADLEALGYEVGAADLCAAGVGAPHIRQRLFWVAHPTSSRRDRSVQESKREAWDKARLCVPSADGRFGSVGHASGAGLEIRRCEPGNDGPELPTAKRASGQSSGLGNPALSQGPRLGQQCIDLSGSAVGWDRFDVLPCLDGKSRRIESGTFPLAHGVSGRVGLLRGYGNAIVPQVAAEFVGAAMETIANAASERPPRSTNETTQDASGGSLR